MKQKSTRMTKEMEMGAVAAVSRQPTRLGGEGLRESEERLRMVLESAGMVTWEWDILGRSILYSNNISALVRGEAVRPYCSLDTLIQEVHPEDREALVRALDRAGQHGTPFECEYRVRVLDGTYRWICGQGKLVVVEEGKPVRVIGLSLDIHERKEAEERLRQSEALYRAIGESVDYGVWVCAPDARNMYASESFLNLVGLTQEQCANFGWGSVLHPDDAERTISAWKECCRTGGRWDIEHRYLGVDGQYHDILARGVPVRNQRGEIVCWAGINLDISRLKRAQQAMRASENRFRLLANTAERLLAAQDPQLAATQLCREVMRFLDCQRFFSYVTNERSEPPKCGSPGSLLVPRLHLDACAGVSDEEARRIEWLDYGVGVCGWVAQDGHPLVVEDIQHSDDPRTEVLKSYGVQACCCHPLLNEGQVMGTLSFGTTTRPSFTPEEVDLMRAITDQVALAMRRRKTLEALEAARAEALQEKNRLAAVMETLPVGVCILNEQGGIVRTNPAYEELWGGPLPPVRGLSDHHVYQACWVSSGKVVQPGEWASARALQLGETVVNQELQIQRVDGRCAYVLNSAAPIRDAQNRIIGCAIAIRDITHHKQAEELNRQLEYRVQQAQKQESLGVMAAGIAHDFNNLLTAVIGNIGLVSAELPSHSPGSRLLRRAEEASSRAAGLCQQLLAYIGKTVLSFSPIQLNQLLLETAPLIAASLPKAVQLQWNLGEKLPVVPADAGQMRQLVMNLVINAWEAIGSQPGQVTITTGSVPRITPDFESPWPQEPLPTGEYVFVEVADTGCGMEPSLLAKVFDPFFSTKFTGRGLGLAAVSGIVRSHHGAIQVQSVPGQGSAFRVWLPAASRPTSAPAPLRRPAADWRGSGTILVVDDEEALRAIAPAMLEVLGFHSVTAADGLEAIEIYRANPERFRCVLLDATMPKLDGAGTFRELVRIRQDVQVILSSGYAKDDIMARFPGSALAGFLQKPYSLQDLSTVLQILEDSMENNRN